MRFHIVVGEGVGSLALAEHLIAHFAGPTNEGVGLVEIGTNGGVGVVVFDFLPRKSQAAAPSFSTLGFQATIAVAGGAKATHAIAVFEAGRLPPFVVRAIRTNGVRILTSNPTTIAVD